MCKSRTVWRGVAFAAATLAAHAAGAATYNEFVSVDLSDVGSAPTFWPLETGPNGLVAQSGSTDFDVLRISVPANHTLDSITIESHDTLVQVFAGIQSGTVWTAGLGTAVDESQTLGWTNFPVDPEASHQGEDILADMGVGAGSTGFLPPLTSGDYTLLFQTVSISIPYALQFNVRARGDFDFDTNVDNDDLFVWADSLGVEGSTEGDADLDGDNDGVDFLIWQGNYGQAAPTPVSAAPEPGGMAMGVAGLAVLDAWRRAATAGGAGAAK